ncbi:MAG: TetR/AcrR family transcriptional regulator [Spirochaetes bacterium]|nr:TetR/AcrR family transcriptional regulator [Spirochaetota bacterium]
MTKKKEKKVRINTILESAVNEFVEKGYENTTMEAIAERSGLTKGGLYYHFKSKDDILVRANEHFMDPIYEIMDEASNASTAAEGLYLYIKKYLTYWYNHPKELSFVFLTMTKTLSNKNIYNIYNNYAFQYISFFKSLYEKGISNNEFISFDTQSISCALLAAIDGITGYVVLDKNLSLEGVIRDFDKVFIKQYLTDKN